MTAVIRALSVWNPWAWALVAGHKPVENRNWPLPQWMRGQLCLIHCGAHRPTREEIVTVHEWAEAKEVEVPRWAYEAGRGVVGALVFDGDVAPAEVTRGAEWALGPRCWTVRVGSAVAFPAAVPCKGKLGFFEPDNGRGGAQSVDVIVRRLLAGAPPPRAARPTEAELRRRVRAALGEVEDSAEAWRRARLAMEKYLGPALGMTPRERWDRMGVLELEQLAEALEERAAIVQEGRTP